MNENLWGPSNLLPLPPPPLPPKKNEPGTSLFGMKNACMAVAWLIISAFFIRKTVVLLKPVRRVLICRLVGKTLVFCLSIKPASKKINRVLNSGPYIYTLYLCIRIYTRSVLLSQKIKTSYHTHQGSARNVLDNLYIPPLKSLW